MRLSLYIRIRSLLILIVLPLALAYGQGTVPTFQHATYTLAGRDPAQGGTTTISTVLVPIALSFDAKKTAGNPFLIDASPDRPRLLHSPGFSKSDFPSGGATQY